MSATPVVHLNFSGTARQALEFYAAAFGGTAVIRTYAEFGMPAELPGASDVVYGQVFGDDGFTVMAYDVPQTERTERLPGSTRRENGTTITDQPFFLALSGATLDEVTALWERLLPEAAIVEPLAASAWSPGFGMLTDRFGVTWTFSVVAPAQG
jgi:PhnB protein